MAQILEPLRVPVVNMDLAVEQTSQDVLHALQKLNSTADAVFLKISSQVKLEKERISRMNERARVCHSKIQQLRGTNKATTVFSTAKYPNPKDLPQHATMFSIMGEAVDSPYPDINDDVRYLPAETKESAVGDRELTRDIHMVYARLNKHGTNMVRAEMVMDDSGLGSVPPQLNSIASLLLFNSNINPYKSYQTMDNLASAGK